MDVRGEITYTRIREIGMGQGRNSHVFLAHDPQLGGQIAVKEIPKDNFPDVDAFFHEAKTMYRVAHENVVPIKCAFQTPDKICLAMEYFEKGSLRDLTAANPIQPKEVIRIGQDMLSGLSSIHINRFIHFDVKPSNILFSVNGHAMVADFGQTRAIGPTGVTQRPPMYVDSIPPECFDGAGIVQSDVYQAGLTLYRAVNGDKCFDAQRPNSPTEREERTIAGTFPQRNRFLPHVPRRLRTVIRKAMAVNPSDRYQSAVEFAEELGRVEFTRDWEVRTFSDGEVSWRSEHLSVATLVVDLKHAGGRRWNVEIFSDNSGRRRYRTADWRANVTLTEANRYLKSLFAELG